MGVCDRIIQRVLTIRRSSERYHVYSMGALTKDINLVTHCANRSKLSYCAKNSKINLNFLK